MPKSDPVQRFLLSLYLTVMVSACAAPEIQPQSSEAISQIGRLSFIKDGVTTREEISDKLGAPRKTFEEERIVIYWMWISDDDVRDKIASLVLVFDKDDVLEKHSLVLEN